MNNLDGLKKSTEELKDYHEKIKKLMAKGKNGEAIEEMVKAFKVANKVLEESNTSLRSILGNLDVSTTKQSTKNSDEDVAPNVHIGTNKYIN